MKFKKMLKTVITNLVWFAFLLIPAYLVTYFIATLSFLISDGASISFPLELAIQLYPLTVSAVVAVIGLYFINHFSKQYR